MLLSELEEMAMDGDADAAAELARRYREGDGVEQNLQTAQIWESRAKVAENEDWKEDTLNGTAGETVMPEAFMTANASGMAAWREAYHAGEYVNVTLACLKQNVNQGNPYACMEYAARRLRHETQGEMESALLLLQNGKQCFEAGFDTENVTEDLCALLTMLGHVHEKLALLKNDPSEQTQAFTAYQQIHELCPGGSPDLIRCYYEGIGCTADSEKALSIEEKCANGAPTAENCMVLAFDYYTRKRAIDACEQCQMALEAADIAEHTDVAAAARYLLAAMGEADEKNCQIDKQAAQETLKMLLGTSAWAGLVLASVGGVVLEAQLEYLQKAINAGVPLCAKMRSQLAHKARYEEAERLKEQQRAQRAEQEALEREAEQKRAADRLIQEEREEKDSLIAQLQQDPETGIVVQEGIFSQETIDGANRIAEQFYAKYGLHLTVVVRYFNEAVDSAIFTDELFHLAKADQVSNLRLSLLVSKDGTLHYNASGKGADQFHRMVPDDSKYSRGMEALSATSKDCSDQDFVLDWMRLWLESYGELTARQRRQNAIADISHISRWSKGAKRIVLVAAIILIAIVILRPIVKKMTVKNEAATVAQSATSQAVASQSTASEVDAQPIEMSVPLRKVEVLDQDNGATLDTEAHTSNTGMVYSNVLYATKSYQAIEFAVCGRYDEFSGTWCIDKNNINTTYENSFKVYADSHLIYTSPVISSGSMEMPFTIDIGNCSLLTVIFEEADGSAMIGDPTMTNTTDVMPSDEEVSALMSNLRPDAWLTDMNLMAGEGVYEHYTYTHLYFNDSKEMTFFLGGAYQSISGTLEASMYEAPLHMEIYADDQLVYSWMDLTSGTIDFNVNINSCQQLRIVLSSSNGAYGSGGIYAPRLSTLTAEEVGA